MNEQYINRIVEAFNRSVQWFEVKQSELRTFDIDGYGQQKSQQSTVKVNGMLLAKGVTNVQVKMEVTEFPKIIIQGKFNSFPDELKKIVIPMDYYL